MEVLLVLRVLLKYDTWMSHIAILSPRITCRVWKIHNFLRSRFFARVPHHDEFLVSNYFWKIFFSESIFFNFRKCFNFRLFFQFFQVSVFLKKWFFKNRLFILFKFKKWKNLQRKREKNWKIILFENLKIFFQLKILKIHFSAVWAFFKLKKNFPLISIFPSNFFSQINHSLRSSLFQSPQPPPSSS